MKKIYFIALAVLGIVLATSCSKEAKWQVNGKIAGATGQLLTLERSLNGYWLVLDSARLDDNGTFKFEQVAAGYPDIYRLRVNDRTAYFPIDSIETVTVEGKLNDFATGYTLKGSEQAIALNDVNTLVNNAISTYGAEAVNDENLKKELSQIILRDMGGIVSYYIVNKEIKGQPIFNPASKADLKIIGAVVNAFSTNRPDDPRTGLLKQNFLSWRRQAGAGVPTEVAVQEITYPEIVLRNAAGKDTPLSSLVGNGKPVIVNFTAYAAENSPAINVALAEVYNAGGVEIYQVSIDQDEYLWREAARNLPWTTVFKSPRDGDKVLVDYNVGVIPMTYIIDRNGQLQERVADLSKLSEVIKKYK